MKSIDKPSKFDEFLLTEKSLSSNEIRGLRLFIDKGCISCHQGQGIGANLFSTNSYPSVEDDYNLKGRFEVTRNLKDLFFYRVPSLRNVTKTPPYYHNGRESNLESVISKKIQFFDNQKPSTDEVKALVSF